MEILYRALLQVASVVIAKLTLLGELDGARAVVVSLDPLFGTSINARELKIEQRQSMNYKFEFWREQRWHFTLVSLIGKLLTVHIVNVIMIDVAEEPTSFTANNNLRYNTQLSINLPEEVYLAKVLKPIFYQTRKFSFFYSLQASFLIILRHPPISIYSLCVKWLFFFLFNIYNLYKLEKFQMVFIYLIFVT